MHARRRSQELLTTFNGTLGQVTLIPNSEGTGIFEVRCVPSPSLREQVVWSRSRESRFPESKELKQRVRDLIAPGRDLGHSDADGDSDLAAAPPPDGFKWGASSAASDAAPPPAKEPEKKASKASWAVWRLLRVLRPERITESDRAEAEKLGLTDDDDE